MNQDFDPACSNSRKPHPGNWGGEDRREDAPRHSGVKFDSTINLGHILTFLGFMIAGFTAWTTLDKRVTVIEERALLQSVIDRNQDATISSNTGQIKESLLEIKSQLSRLADRIDPVRRAAP